MTKATVIIGENESGKTLTAKLLSKDYPKEEVVWIAGREFKNHHFAFRQCTLETTCVIIDDLQSLKDFEFLVMLVHGIKVEKQGHSVFEINPKIILIYDQAITKNQFENLGLSFNRRIEVVECKKENLEELIQSLK